MIKCSLNFDLLRAWNRSPSAFLLCTNESNELKSIQMGLKRVRVTTRNVAMKFDSKSILRKQKSNESEMIRILVLVYNIIRKVHVLCYIWYVSSPKRRWHHVTEHVVDFAANSVKRRLCAEWDSFFYVYVCHSLALLWTAIYVECVYGDPTPSQPTHHNSNE